MSKKYTFIDTVKNTRTFADETNRLSVLSFSVRNGSAGKAPMIVPILRTGLVYTSEKRQKPDGCADECASVLVTRKVSIETSSAFADAAELALHLDEAVRVFKDAWASSLKNGFLPPINSDFYTV